MKSRRSKVSILIPIFVGIITILALSVFGLINFRNATNTTQEQIIKKNRQLLSLSSTILFNPIVDGDLNKVITHLDEFVQDEEILYAAARDTTSNVIADSREQGWLPPGQEVKTLAQQSFSQQQLFQFEHQNALIIAGPIVSESTRLGTLEIAFDLSQTQKSSRATTINMILSGLGILVVLILISILFTRFATGQLQKVVAAAEEIGRGNLDIEIPSIGVDEIAIVGETLDNTRVELKKLNENYQEQLENLERRTQYLEATASVARDTTSLLDQQELLSRVVTLIDERFDFHQYAVYLLDDSGEWVELKAVSGAESSGLLKNDTRFRVGQEGIISHVALTGRHYISQDVSSDPYYLSDASTKNINSELAFPLVSRGEVIGILDIQSKEINAFGSEEISVLQTLADQLAIAISNANLFHESQENFLAIQQIYSQTNPDTWRELLGGEKQLSYYCDEEGIVSFTEISAKTSVDDLPELDIPITIRGGQVIGRIKAHKTENSDDWNLDEISVMETLVEQLSAALESAQLFQETQRRMGFEQMTREASIRMRESLDVGTVIQTAAAELRKALNLSEVEIRMGTVSED